MGRRLKGDWYELSGRTSTGNLIIKFGDPLDGRASSSSSVSEDIDDLIHEGALDRAGFPVRLVPSQQGSKRADFLWAGGLPIKVVSTRFVELLKRIGATGFTTCSVDLVDRKGQAVPGYVAILVDRSVSDPDIRNFRPDSPLDHHTFKLVVKGWVVKELRAAGITGMRIEHALTNEEQTERYGTKPQESSAMLERLGQPGSSRSTAGHSAECRYVED